MMNRTRSHQADMEFVDIPGTSMRVSRVALGTWAIGGWMWGGSNENDAVSTIHAALERGINLIDTAPVYGFGRSEEIVGKALAIGGRRKRAFIATKVGLDWKDGKPFRNASKARIIEEAENSLRRLQTDVIDLYQVHWPDPHTPIAEVAEAIGELHKAGKIRAIGVSNFSPVQMEEFRKVAPLHAAQPPTTCSNARSNRTFFPTAAPGTSRCSPMARCAGDFCPAACPHRAASPATISAKAIRNFSAPDSSSISPRSRGSTNSRKNVTASG